jgi:predicted nucleic acid-binding protein
VCYLLEAPLAVGADIVVTRDRDLLDAQGVSDLFIVDPRGFRNLVTGSD